VNEMRKCPKCRRGFGTREALNSHLGHAHSKGKEYTSRNTLQKLYWEKEMTVRDIAEMFGVDNATICYHMKKLGIERRDKSVNVNESVQTNHLELSSSGVEFIEGCLLGDGCISNHGKVSARYAHTDSNFKYMTWLSSKLSEFGIKQAGEIRRNKRGEDSTYQYWSRSYPELRKLGENWYGTKGKRIPSDFEISSVKVFNWYIGDGSLYENRSCGLRSRTFSKEKLEKIVSQLRDKGIEASTVKSGIYILVSSSIDFFEYMLESNLAPPSYSYKFYEPFRSEIYG